MKVATAIGLGAGIVVGVAIGSSFGAVRDLRSVKNNVGEEVFTHQDDSLPHDISVSPLSIALSCWSDPCRGIFGSVGVRILEDMGHTVTHIDILDMHRRQSSVEEFVERLEGHDVVFWWNWDLPIKPEELPTLRRKLPPGQIWTLFNWDDPHAWGRNAPEARRTMIKSLASTLDLVYTSGSSTIDMYREAGSKVVQHVMVPYSDLYHHFDPDPAFACDINFIATNYYDSFEGMASSRRGIVEALAAATDIDAVFYSLDPGNSNNTDAFRSEGISFEKNRKAFSSCKLTLNLLAAALDECPNGHKYSNERVTTAMASGAVQLVEKHPCNQGTFVDGKTGIVLRSTIPSEVVAQVREIISNFRSYEHIREEAILTAQKWHISTFLQSFLSDVDRMKRSGLTVSH